jgi:hypothetical protein
MRFRRRKSRRQQAADLIADSLKLEAASKAAKGATKAAKGTAAYQAAKRTPILKRVPLILAAAGIVAAVVTKVLRGGSDESSPAPA